MLMLWCGRIILTPPREWWHMGWSSHLTPGPETQSSSNLHNTPAVIWPTILHAALGKNNMKMWSLQSLNVNQLRIHFVVGFLHVWENTNEDDKCPSQPTLTVDCGLCIVCQQRIVSSDSPLHLRQRAVISSVQGAMCMTAAAGGQSPHSTLVGKAVWVM